MTETTKHEHSGLNTLREETDCKTVDKEIMNVEEAENDTNSSTSSIAYDKNVDMPNNQTEGTDFKTVDKQTVNAKEAENDTKSSTSSIAYDNNEDMSNNQTDTIMVPEMEGAAVINEMNRTIRYFAPGLNSNLGTNCRVGISSDIDVPRSVTVRRSTASILGEMCEDALNFLARARDLKSKANTYAQKLNKHMEVFPKKVAEYGRGGKDFYDALTTKYESFLENVFGDLQTNDEIRNMETAADKCTMHAEAAAELNNSEVPKTVIKEFAKAICDFLDKERELYKNMTNMWVKVRMDLKEEERRRLSAEKKSKDYKIFLVSATFCAVGITLTSFVNIEPVKFYIQLGLGSLFTVSLVMCWLHYCLKKRCNRTNEDTTESRTEDWLEISFTEGIISECRQHLEIIDKEREEYRVLSSDAY